MILAAYHGRWAIVRLLLEAGGDADACLPNGQTPLYWVAIGGDVKTLKLLLSFGVDPARAVAHPLGVTRVALDGAAQQGHLEIVRELLKLGIDACGGASLGVDAMVLAAIMQHVNIMTLLRDAGVVDMEGKVLTVAAQVATSSPSSSFCSKSGLSAGEAPTTPTATTPLAPPLCALALGLRLPESSACYSMPEQTRDRPLDSRIGPEGSSLSRPLISSLNNWPEEGPRKACYGGSAEPVGGGPSLAVARRGRSRGILALV